MSEEYQPRLRISFNKGYTEQGFAEQVYHLHVREAGDCDELYFRDYLLEHPDIAGQYAILKQKLKEKFEHNRDAYTQAKTEFVNKYTCMARKELGPRYGIYEAKPGEVPEHLFQGWNETLIWSCLQGYMGQAYVDPKVNPVSAKVVIGDFCFFAGIPSEALVRHIPYDFPSKEILMIPQNENWSDLIKEIWKERAAEIKRYAIKKEPDIFNKEKLEGYIQSLPKEYSLLMIDEELYYETRKQEWSKDLTSQFPDHNQYKEHGIGVVALHNGMLAAGASSYTVYDKGIEIEIDTEESHRRKGLALACGAKLILECLKRGWYPSWDAHDLRSVALAEKLGYHMDAEYTAYTVKTELDRY